MTATGAKITTWQIDPAHSSAEFAIRHMMVTTISGRMNLTDGHIEFDPDDLQTAEVRATIDPASINTGNPQRDGHLQSDGFFNVEHHPEISFESVRIQPATDQDHFNVTGNLTLLGNTQEIELEARFGGQILDGYGKQRVGFQVRGVVPREDFGMTSNQPLDNGGVVFGNDVAITLNIAAVPVE